jgi:penicillin-binding protein 1A
VLRKKQDQITGLGLGHKNWLFDEEDSAPSVSARPQPEPRTRQAEPRTRQADPNPGEDYGFFVSYRRQTPKLSTHGPRKLAGRLALLTLALLAISTGSLSGLILVYSAELPQIHDLERYRPSTTTDLYDQKGRLIGSFALERRVIVNYEDLSPTLRQAVISIEDKSFESHWGINVFRVVGAVWHDIRSKGRSQGASTLTMQLARNLFLSSERSATRKIQEAYLAIQIERAFTKEQIFTLYANQIYLGSGMYGFEAGSEYYFSKHAKDLTLPEAALLAGLPKGPESYSPLRFPDKAIKRRNLVLSEMESDGAITHAEAEEARQAPLGLNIAQPGMSAAPWFEEEVRRELEKRFGTEQVHEAGLRVDTTLDLDLQVVANRAVSEGLLEYEHRHGWKGKLENALMQGQTLESYKHPDWAVHYKSGDFVHALVMRSFPKEIYARVGSQEVLIKPEDWKWTGQKNGQVLVKPGDVIYVRLLDAVETTLASHPRRATLEQDSGVQGALLTMDNASGDVLAMVGGRDYALSEFNRATQAERQTGSSFKPYVYAAAVEDGVKPDELIVDAPVSFNGWSPRNYEGNYLGAMTVEHAFAESRNVPAIKLADRVGMHKVIDMAHRFGVTSTIPPYLPVALGAVEISLEEQVASYSVFPNDGIRVKPRFIRKVSNADGITLWEEPPAITEVVSQQTARTMMLLLRAVTRSGTGAAASQLQHAVGGKTGTTSDYTDAWFLGFSPSVTCGVWVGFDGRQSLGEKETGARAALPIWMDMMRAVIVNAKPDEAFPGDAPGSDTLQNERLAVNQLTSPARKDVPKTAMPISLTPLTRPAPRASIAPTTQARITPTPPHRTAYQSALQPLPAPSSAQPKRQTVRPAFQ